MILPIMDLRILLSEGEQFLIELMFSFQDISVENKYKYSMALLQHAEKASYFPPSFKITIVQQVRVLIPNH